MVDGSGRTRGQATETSCAVVRRQDMELLADYYAIVRSMEKLEKAYIGGHIGDDRVYEQVQPSFPSLFPLSSFLFPLSSSFP
jgi:hypothetical protein